MEKKPHVAILGGGPAGLGAAYQVIKEDLASVTIVEKEDGLGGIAGSFHICGVNVDYGSHRLHPACDPEIMVDLKSLLGDELMKRPRHGRIRLFNRWIHFPLKPLDLSLKLPFSFTINTVIDLIQKSLGSKKQKFETESFAGVLESELGRTICHEFYFPYIRKIWGLLPEEISPTQAHKRVSANSLKKMFRKIFSAVPGFKQPGSGFFFYPREGFGQIVCAMAAQARRAGVDIRLQSSINSIHLGQPHCIDLKRNGQVTSIQADHVWSTIPVMRPIRLPRVKGSWSLRQIATCACSQRGQLTRLALSSMRQRAGRELWIASTREPWIYCSTIGSRRALSLGRWRFTPASEPC